MRVRVSPLAIASILIATGCGSDPNALDKPVIGHAGDYKIVLAEAERLSKEPLQKIANDEELTPQDMQSLTAASVQFQALVDFEPGLFAPHLALGMIYRSLGELETAERHLRQCLNNIPASVEDAIRATVAETHYQLSRVLFDRGKYKDAVSEATTAIKAEPHNPNYFAGRASALAQLDQRVEAKKDLRQALSLDPHHKRAKGLLKLLK